MHRIKFYEGEYYLLSNFSAHEVSFEGETYKTAEHAYQVAKFRDTVMRDKIRNAPSAYLAREWAQVKEGRTEGFEERKVAIMNAIMKAKAEQHADVREKLVATGDTILEKNHPLDAYWGTGADGAGENVMGKLWMEIREEMRD